jgi:hypothetical protein
MIVEWVLSDSLGKSPQKCGVPPWGLQAIGARGFETHLDAAVPPSGGCRHHLASA